MKMAEQFRRTCRSARPPAPIARALAWAIQLLIFALSGWVAFLLRFDLRLPDGAERQLEVALAVWIAVKAAGFRMARLDRERWRYFSSHDALRVCRTSAIASAVCGMLIVLAIPTGFPRSVYILDFLACTLLTVSARFGVQMLADGHRTGSAGGMRTRALIYGAGAAGQMLLREIRSSPHFSYEVAGFVDDDAEKNGMKLQGAPVLGIGTSLASLVKELSIAEVLIAIPGADTQAMSRVLRHCRAAGVRCKTLPSLAEILNGTHAPAAIRDVAVEDLLGRPPNRLDEERIRRQVAGRVVLVTGAAGSIGSELCRQLARFAPRAIVGFDIAETGLFHLDRQMRELYPAVAFRAEVGNVQHRLRVDEVLAEHRPSLVYHAAAYKHVPLMEAHAFEAVENNVFGTLEMAAASADHGVEAFVMISSDKAVRPTNVMGASKRIAEMVVHAQQGRGPRYASVRFGNVLGSNGSVVPIFKQQIANGGPVCVTHPDMVRYFMTIPEAAQLVLQASTMGRGGEVFVLDMGEPVRIVDLARNLIRLSGLRPDTDIRIAFTGLRPGEKLVEELIRQEEVPVATAHEKIRVFAGENPPWSELAPGLELLRELCRTRDERDLVRKIMALVPEYRPDPRLMPAAALGARAANHGRRRESEDLRRMIASLGESVLAFQGRTEQQA